ncbi:hypothetical protein BGZ60DRAFT_524629 [Tricladium varicosporioides]|nr:hypothetical protein BGZ60DRAFT_524629 [Hymenoscyphus varicosporioides]
MANLASQKWKIALQIERDLGLLLKDRAPRFDAVDSLITQLRIAAEATIFLDFEYATQEGVERHLWDAHIKINQRYRKIVDHYRQGDQKKHVVERRKLEKRYADFIKTSQFFYKGYIQRLASHFAGLKELRRIAHRLSLSTLTADDRVKVSPEVEHMIDMSCHATLLRLGDLSRYRNNLRIKDKSWEPALGYYRLANDLIPEDGSAHNQMAVIALADGNHLDAVYHLYRALAVNEPHTLAKGNLEIEFKKITSAWEKKRSQPKKDGLDTLTWWFVLLHARFYDGKDFSTREELENEVLSRLALLLKEQSFGETLEKFVLINIAAEFFAGEKIEEEGDSLTQETISSFYYCLAFNVRMMFMLLQVLQPELDDTASGEELPSDDSSPSRPREKITAVTRRILPALRQYSVWLVTRAEHIATNVGSGLVNVHIKELWKMYADILTRLANVFPAESLQSVSYLLEEDETTVGFRPLRDPGLDSACDLYTDEDGQIKQRITDPGIKRNLPNVEMVSRVRNIILCGLILHTKDECPLRLDSATNEFQFIEEGLPTHTIASPLQAHATSPTFETPLYNNSTPSMSELKKRFHQYIPEESIAASDSHNSMDTYMRSMVDNLVDPSSCRPSGSDETSYGMHSATANEVFAPISSNCFQSHHQSTPKMLPSLPGLWNSAFTPQPNELQPTSPNRPTTARQLSPLPFATPKKQMAAAAALDEMTGYGPSTRSSWDRQGSRPNSKPIAQSVNDILQAQLAQQFMPLSMSSGFPDSSSIYANPTPAHQQINGRGFHEALPGALPAAQANNSTIFPWASDFENHMMLQSSLWNGSQPRLGSYSQTPPGGQWEKDG